MGVAIASGPSPLQTRSTNPILSNYETLPVASQAKQPMTTTVRPEGTNRTPWRSVAIPNEHGGWGLTFEPVLLGLLIAPSLAGACLGVAAVLAFLVRTPLKLVSIDLRHHRWIDRSRLAVRFAAAELLAIAALAVGAVLLAGWAWTAVVAIATPLVALEWWYDSRGRGRRLVPELAGAVGIAAVAAVVITAGGGASALAAGAWIVLAARSVGSIPFVRTQIARLRRGSSGLRTSDLAQLVALLTATVALVVDARLLAGAIGVGLIAALQVRWVRRAPVAPKRLGFTQLGLGIALVLLTATGVLLA